MKKPNLQNFGNACKQHIPEISTGFGIGAFLAAIGLSIVATTKSVRKIDKEEEKLKRKLTGKEKFKLIWKDWTAPVISTGAGITGVLYGNNEHLKQRRATVTALAAERLVSEGISRRLDAYQHITEKNVDEETKEKINKEYNDSNTTYNIEPLRVSSDKIKNEDQYLCWEPIKDVMFWGSVREIKEAIADVQFKIAQEPVSGGATYRDLMSHFNLSPNHNRLPEDSDNVGWNLTHQCVANSFNKVTMLENDRRVLVPVLILDLKYPPKEEYYKEY